MYNPSREKDRLFIIECLKGSYTPIGIERWFARPRESLGRKSPNWIFEREPDKIGLVIELARSVRDL